MESVMMSKRMKAELKPKGDWSKLPLFDRTGWKQVRFPDVVHRADGRYDRASANTDIQRWVAGEHIDEGDLHIRRESFTDDALFPPTFRFTFKAGHVLLHSRNPKKVAVPHFDGITGEKLFVLKPKDENVLLKDFLPFVLLSEQFQQWAVENSSGSVNKFLNWSALERYSFALPPLGQQRRMAELLWAVDSVKNSYRALAEAGEQSYHAILDDFFFGGGAANDHRMFNPVWEVARLEDIVLPDAAIRYGVVQVGLHDEDGVPTIAIKDLKGDFRKGVHKTSKAKEGQYANSRIQPRDVLLSVKASVGEVALVPEHFTGNIGRDVARIRCGPKLKPEVLLHLIRSHRYQSYIEKHVVGSTRKEISIHRLRNFNVPVPTPIESASFTQRVNSIEEAMALARNSESATRLLRTSLINSLG